MAQAIKISLSGNEPVSESRKSDIQAEIRDNELYVTGVPDGHTLEYVARDTETKSKLFVVHRAEERRGYDPFRLYVGAEAQLVEAQIQRVVRYRDGGTIDIDYILAGNHGRLHFPAPVDWEGKPTDTYQGKTVELEKMSINFSVF